jgi:small subunit ribosomal protein S15
MALRPGTKAQIIGEYGSKEGDTGSPEVQIAMLTRRINPAQRAPEGAQA